jgi:hypothetical protein
VNDPTDAAVIALERRFSGWMIWTVRSWNGHAAGIIWCARRWDETGDVLNAGSAAALEEALKAATL